MTRHRDTIRLEENHARILRGDQPEQMLAYDDATGWRALKSDLAGQAELTAIVPSQSTLRMALPVAPHSARELRAMLELSAPLPPRDLLWTYPAAGGGGVEAVTLVRKEWLGPRVAAIRRHLGPIDMLVVDADREPFLSGRPPQARFRRLGLPFAAIVIVLAAITAWQLTSTPPRLVAAPHRQAHVVVKPAPATVAETRPSPMASGETELVLLGIAGRLPDDADVLVKTPWGKTTTMRMGDSLLGWKLVAVAPDKIALEKDGARDELVLEPAA